MEISKVINNNVVLTHDDQGKELVVMGVGTGLQEAAGRSGGYWTGGEDLRT